MPSSGNDMTAAAVEAAFLSDPVPFPHSNRARRRKAKAEAATTCSAHKGQSHFLINGPPTTSEGLSICCFRPPSTRALLFATRWGSIPHPQKHLLIHGLVSPMMGNGGCLQASDRFAGRNSLRGAPSVDLSLCRVAEVQKWTEDLQHIQGGFQVQIAWHAVRTFISINKCLKHSAPLPSYARLMERRPRYEQGSVTDWVHHHIES